MHDSWQLFGACFGRLLRSERVAYADGLVVLREIERQLEGAAAQGRAARLLSSVQLAIDVGRFSAAAQTGGGFLRNVDNVVLAPLACGGEDGILLAVMTGNEKDEGCSIASGLVALAFLTELGGGLLSSADVGPALRRAALTAHERVFSANESPLAPYSLATVMGARKNLRGIGCSLTAVVLLPSLLHGIHLGEGHAYVAREGSVKRLTIEHTLARDPQYREQADGFPFAESVVLKVLGLTEHLPEVDVFRLELEPGDVVVVGNQSLKPRLATVPAGEASPQLICERLASAMALDFRGAPASVGAVRIR